MPENELLLSDGSSFEDAKRVPVNRAEEPLRWRCPEGHTNWDRTNSHIWCASCRRANERGEDVDPEHYEIVDEANDTTIPWSAVNLVDE